jgi:ribonuclease-3
MKQSEALEAALGYTFTDPTYLRQALTHRSHGSPHNERLEFLGDSVLNCVMAWLLYERFGDMREGDLSRLRANLVRQETLHQIAKGLDLGGHMFLGDGELKSGGHRRPSILADTLEALFGAVLLDGGFDRAHAVIAGLYAPLLAEVETSMPGKDPKTALQEHLQGQRHARPEYVLLATRGEAHAQQFEVECGVPELGIRAVGTGTSRRAAEQQAAQRVLDLVARR